MKKKPSPAAISAFAFREDDAQPFGRTSRLRELFRKAFCQQKYTLLSDKKQKHGKNTRSKKKHKKRSKKFALKKNAAVKEIRENWSSSGSDDIEVYDSDLGSDQDAMKNLEMRFGGACGVLQDPYGMSNCEEFETEKKQEVVFDGGPFLLLPCNVLIFSYQFIFTAKTVLLKIQNEGLEHNVTWPVHEIQSFRSLVKVERGLAFVELDLTERGQLIFSEALKGLFKMDNYCVVTSLCSPTADINSFEKEIKHITSLSDQYKSMWRPGEEDVMEMVQKVWEQLCSQRQCVDNLECVSLLGDDIVQNSDRVSLDDWIDLVYPTKEDHDAVTVTKYDYMLLDPNEFISDTVIDFYIKYIQSQLQLEDKKRFYFYNSFFFRKLTEIDKNSLHGVEKHKNSFERVKRWTARMDIFEKDYLFIPIMQCAHWSLVIVCHAGCLSADRCDMKVPVILHFDSLEGSHAGIEGPIRNYLVEAWNERQGRNEDLKRLAVIKFVTTKVPQQTNYSDCGLFLLHYVELFVQAVLEKDTLDFITEEWFNPADASRKREVIKSLIQRLKVEQLDGRHDCLQHNEFVSKPSDSLKVELSDQGDSPHVHSQHNVQGSTSLKLTHSGLPCEHHGSDVVGQCSYHPVEGQTPCAGLDIGSCSHQQQAAENKLPDIQSMEDCKVCFDNMASAADEVLQDCPIVCSGGFVNSHTPEVRAASSVSYTSIGTPDTQNLQWQTCDDRCSSPLAFCRHTETDGDGTSVERQGIEIVEIESNECRHRSRAHTFCAPNEQWKEQETISCALGIEHIDSELCQVKESAKRPNAKNLLEEFITEDIAASGTLVTTRTSQDTLTDSTSPVEESNAGLIELHCISSDEEQISSTIYGHRRRGRPKLRLKSDRLEGSGRVTRSASKRGKPEG